jgi:membrane protein YdbS with pleckstrin-like domain
VTQLVPGELEWQRVSSKYVVVDVVGYLVSTVIATAVATIPYWIWRSPWLLAITAAVALVGVVTLALTPRRVRSIGYCLREDDIVFGRGIAWRRSVAIPYGRMQLIDISAGPLARALGLSELRFVTAAASSAIVVPGLPTATAEQLRDRLVALAESRRAGL